MDQHVRENWRKIKVWQISTIATIFVVFIGTLIYSCFVALDKDAR